MAFMFFVAIESASAKIAGMSLVEMIKRSEMVVLAKVEKIEERKDFRRATATVSEVWKGRPIENVQFSALSTWTCDITSANVGETVVLFLAKGKSGDLEIMVSGRGRMPIKAIGSEQYAEFWKDIVMPEGTPSVALPGQNPVVIKGISLARLKKLVTQAQK